MRTNGEIERDTQVVATLRNIAETMRIIACLLADIHEGLKPPPVIIPPLSSEAVERMGEE